VSGAGKTVTIDLAEPIDNFGKPCPRVVLREPTYATYARLGEPYSFGRTRDGIIINVLKDEVLAAYVEACLVEPTNAGLLATLALVDAKRLRKAVLDFFSRADEAISDAPSES
jgi:hypothetical protein